MSGQGGHGGGGRGRNPEAALPAGGTSLDAEAASDGQRQSGWVAGSASQVAGPGPETGSQGQSGREERGGLRRPSEEHEQAQAGDSRDHAAFTDPAQGQLTTHHDAPDLEPQSSLASPRPDAEALRSGMDDSGQRVAQVHQAPCAIAGQVQAGPGLGLATPRQSQAGAPLPAVYVSLDLSNSSSPDRRASLDPEGSAYGARARALAQNAQQVLQHIETDAAAAGESVGELLGQLSAFLHDAAANTAAHAEVERDAAGLLQAAALDAAARGNKMVNSYLRLHEELRDLPRLCLLVKALRQRVDLFDSQLRHFLPR